MNIFTCDGDLEGILSCIYSAWASGLGQQNIRIMVEPVEQYTFFDTYTYVPTDREHAQSVCDSVHRKISARFYHDISCVALSSSPERADIMYRMLLLGFRYGDACLEMLQFRAVSDFFEARRQILNESHHFLEFIRFHAISNNVYVAHIEPKGHVLLLLADHFADRMPSEHWMIVDDVHSECIVHPCDEKFYIRSLSKEELDRLLMTEETNDGFTDLWKVFFDTIAIKERENYICQRNLFPKWKRKHAVEFL